MALRQVVVSQSSAKTPVVRVENDSTGKEDPTLTPALRMTPYFSPNVNGSSFAYFMDIALLQSERIWRFYHD